jgi:hypothetical protein
MLCTATDAVEGLGDARSREISALLEKLGDARPAALTGPRRTLRIRFDERERDEAWTRPAVVGSLSEADLLSSIQAEVDATLEAANATIDSFGVREQAELLSRKARLAARPGKSGARRRRRGVKYAVDQVLEGMELSSQDRETLAEALAAVYPELDADGTYISPMSVEEGLAAAIEGAAGLSSDDAAAVARVRELVREDMGDAWKEPQQVVDAGRSAVESLFGAAAAHAEAAASASKAMTGGRRVRSEYADAVADGAVEDVRGDEMYLAENTVEDAVLDYRLHRRAESKWSNRALPDRLEGKVPERLKPLVSALDANPTMTQEGREAALAYMLDVLKDKGEADPLTHMHEANPATPWRQLDFFEDPRQEFGRGRTGAAIAEEFGDQGVDLDAMFGAGSEEKLAAAFQGVDEGDEGALDAVFDQLLSGSTPDLSGVQTFGDRVGASDPILEHDSDEEEEGFMDGAHTLDRAALHHRNARRMDTARASGSSAAEVARDDADALEAPGLEEALASMGATADKLLASVTDDVKSWEARYLGGGEEDLFSGDSAEAAKAEEEGKAGDDK